MQVPIQIIVIPGRPENYTNQHLASANTNGALISVNMKILPPHHLLIEGDRLQLSVNVILVTVFGCVGEWSDLNLTFGDTAHVVVLNGDPVHQRPEDLILDLLDATVLVKVFGVGHHSCGDDLKQSQFRKSTL